MSHDIDDETLQVMLDKAALCGARKALQELSIHDLSTHEGRQAQLSDAQFAHKQRKGAEILNATARRAGVWAAVGTLVTAAVVGFLHSIGWKSSGG